MAKLPTMKKRRYKIAVFLKALTVKPAEDGKYEGTLTDIIKFTNGVRKLANNKN